MLEDRPQRRSWRDRIRGVKAQVSANRRRWLFAGGVVVAAIVILVIVPGYIALQPQFLQRYDNMRDPYKTWSTSVHAQVPCQSCHVPANRAAQAVYDVRMLGEFYLSLVNPSSRPNTLSDPTNDACQSCHIDLRAVSPSGDLSIPHGAHVTLLKIRCVECHKYLVHETNPKGTHTPWMAKCLTCHNGTTAKNNCSACHTSKRIPASHQAANWLVIHPEQQKVLDCTKCHKWTANWCAQCHSRRPRSHTRTWRTDHAQKVRAHRNCEACHRTTFCARCHGELPALNFNPALKVVR